MMTMPHYTRRQLGWRLAAALGAFVAVAALVLALLGLTPLAVTILYLVCGPVAVYVAVIAFWPAVRDDTLLARRRNAAIDAEDVAVARARDVLAGG